MILTHIFFMEVLESREKIELSIRTAKRKDSPEND